MVSHLHEKAVQAARNYLKAESDLIEILQKMDQCRGYRELGFKSLFDYATQSLKLSEAVSYNLIVVARKSREVPQLQEMIRSQEITLSNARMIAPVLKPENQDKWLEAASTLSKRELEREIVKVAPALAVQETARFVAPERVELKVGVSEQLHQKLKRVQDLIASKTKAPASLEVTLEALVELYLEREDPVKKSERFQSKSRAPKPPSPRIQRKSAAGDSSSSIEIAQPSPVPGQAQPENTASPSPSPIRARIPAFLQHQINLRDHGRCAHVDTNGNRCDQRRWLDIHHIQPVSRGGTNEFNNLLTLCKGHHQMRHH